MDRKTFERTRRSVDTPSGRISYVEHGSGPAALFVHGVLLNGWLWRHQLAGLADVRRCIAVDLLAHGATTIDPAQRIELPGARLFFPEERHARLNDELRAHWKAAS